MSASPFSFIAVNDLHHGSPECGDFLRGLVHHMAKQGPARFCIIAGDLSDAGDPASFATVRDRFAQLEVPIYTVPGNHDCDREGDTRLYAAYFPGRSNYHFSCDGWQFIGLDSTDGRAWHDTRVSARTLAWLDERLPQLDPRAPTVLFTHFPLGDIGWMTPLNAAEVLRRLDSFNLRAALCGHFHGATEQVWGKGVLTTGACCSRMRQNHDGTLPEGYLWCTAHPDGRLERRFVEYAPARKAEALEPIPLGPASTRKS